MFDKKINLKSYDQVGRDLSMEYFSYEYDLDGNWMKLNGRLADNQLKVDIETRGQKRRQTIPVKGKLYPTSIIGLYPAMHGLKSVALTPIRYTMGKLKPLVRLNKKF